MPMSWEDAGELAAAQSARLREKAEAQRAVEAARLAPLEEGRLAILDLVPMIFQTAELLKKVWPQDASDYSTGVWIPRQNMYSASITEVATPGPWPMSFTTRGIEFSLHGGCAFYDSFAPGAQSVAFAAVRASGEVHFIARNLDRAQILARSRAAKAAAEWTPMELARTLRQFGIPLPTSTDS